MLNMTLFFEEDDPDAEDKHLLIGFDCMRRTVTIDDKSNGYL
jgi:hypothetical protein